MVSVLEIALDDVQLRSWLRERSRVGILETGFVKRDSYGASFLFLCRAFKSAAGLLRRNGYGVSFFLFLAVALG